MEAHHESRATTSDGATHDRPKGHFLRLLGASGMLDDPSSAAAALPLRRVDGPASPARPLLPRKREKRPYSLRISGTGH